MTASTHPYKCRCPSKSPPLPLQKRLFIGIVSRLVHYLEPQQRRERERLRKPRLRQPEQLAIEKRRDKMNGRKYAGAVSGQILTCVDNSLHFKHLILDNIT